MSLSRDSVVSPRGERSGRSYRTILVALVAVVLLGTSLLLAAGSVRAVSSTGTTEALVNTGQLIRDASSATPVIGFNMTSTNPNDALDSIRIQFTGAGFTAGDDRDIRRLNVDSSVSGVGLYRDTGSTDDILDATDVPVALNGISWVANVVVIDLTSHNEKLPASAAGRLQWFIVIRTADVPGNLANGDQIISTIPSGGIRATNIDLGGGAFITQPTAPVISNTLTVRLTRTVDMLVGIPRWIGPDTATVNSMAVLGLSIVDGGIVTNHGIQDSIQSIVLTLTETGGTVSSVDFKPITTDARTSGIAYYLDAGTVNDAWDAGDIPITLASISPANFGPGGVTITATFQAPGLVVPDANTGTLDIFVVVRTASISTFDSFDLQISADDIVVAGVLAPQGGADASLATPLNQGNTVVPSSDVIGDATPPRLRGLTWIEASPNLAALGLDLYFNHQMTTTQFGDVTGQARDDESGLAQASFSAEPGLASSPPPAALSGAGIWRSWSGAYGFSASSTDASSPAVVTVSDAVGNTITTTATREDFRYRFTTQSILIVPSPGWIVPATPPFWVDGAGKLWFSNLFTGTMTATVQVDLTSLFGGGLANASASAEPSLAGGPRPAFVAYPPGTDTATFAVDYDFTAASTGESSPVRITVFDNSGLSSSMDFPYGLDVEGPAITFLAPAAGSTVSGTVMVRANVADALTAVDSVEVEVDPSGGFMRMFFDGTNYFLPISSALFADGNHRLIVRAVDVVGNENVVGIDVVFKNSAVDATPPAAAFVAPLQNAVLTGTVVVQVQASDNVAVARVDLRIGASPTVAMAFNGATGRYEYSWATTALSDGAYPLAATAVDSTGNLGSAIPVDVKVDNTPPAVAFITPGSNALVAGLVDVHVSALDFGGVASVTLTAGGSNASMASLGDGTYRYLLDSSSLGPGAVTLTVTATDIVGLTTTKSVSVRVDNAGPTLTLASPSSDRGAIVLRATVSDSPAGVASVVFIVDGKTYAGVSDGSGGYSVTIFTTTADNGGHAYDVVATDRLGNTASASGMFNVNNPADTFGAVVAASPFLIFLVLLAAFLVAIVVLFKRRKKPEPAAGERASGTGPEEL